MFFAAESSDFSAAFSRSIMRLTAFSRSQPLQTYESPSGERLYFPNAGSLPPVGFDFPHRPQVFVPAGIARFWAVFLLGFAGILGSFPFWDSSGSGLGDGTTP